MSRLYSRTEPLITVERLKNTFLFGVDLRNPNGNILPDSVLESYINVAISYLEQELRCPIEPQDIVHSVDYYYNMYRQFVFIQLPVYPIVKNSVTEIKLNFSDNFSIAFPKEWYRTYEISGQIQLLPTQSTFTSFFMTHLTSIVPIATSFNYAPQLLKITYKDGIADEAGKVPPLINQAIGLYASLYLLQMLGDIGPTGGAGISSQSLSLDGMSQSVTTAISATNNLYGATILNYKTQLDKTVIKVLKRTYKRIGLEYM